MKFYSIPSKWVNNKSFFTKRIAPNSILCGTWSDYKKPSLQHTWVGLPCQLTNESAIWNAFAINSQSNVENIFIISNSTCHLPNSHLCKFFYKQPVCTKLIFYRNSFIFVNSCLRNIDYPRIGLIVSSMHEGRQVKRRLKMFGIVQKRKLLSRHPKKVRWHVKLSPKKKDGNNSFN